MESSPVVNSAASDSSKSVATNGQATAGAIPPATIADIQADGAGAGGPDVTKRDSLSRRFARKPAAGGHRSTNEGMESRPVGVELVDKPMDD